MLKCLVIETEIDIPPTPLNKTSNAKAAGRNESLRRFASRSKNSSEHHTIMSRPEDQLYAVSEALLRAELSEANTNMFSIARRTSTTMTQPHAHTPHPLEYNIFSRR